MYVYDAHVCKCVQVRTETIDVWSLELELQCEPYDMDAKPEAQVLYKSPLLN